ncbi:hypothetical protein KFE98_19305 [bacterium SCSIO 12741]|nr:hypothetical protein KFE98_19305 [bacterium SCSIO 12741]
MKPFVYLMLMLTVTLVGCDSNKVYEEHQELSDNVEWKREDSRTFKVKIEDTSVPYNLSISFRYANGFAYRTLKLKSIETGPSGTTTEAEYDLLLVDEKGDYIGEPGYDIWDSDHLVVRNRRFDEPGIYTFTLEHAAEEEVVNLAMEVGMIVKKVPAQP